MAIFKKTPPTATDLADQATAATTHDADVEKNFETVKLENTAEDAPQRHPNIDPALERRVLKKLDWNLVLLVTFLCMYAPTLCQLV